MKSLRLHSLVPALLTLMAVSVVVAQTLPNDGKAPAVRPPHHHFGPPPRAGGRLGDPLPNLTQDQLTDFSNGLDQFENVETVASGLGPIFNDISCANCHTSPAIGGSSGQLETRFGRMDKGTFDPLTELGGTLLQNRAIDPAVLERIPREATVIAERKALPLFGLGLIEAIEDKDIQDLVKRKKADGVLGRAALIKDVTTGEMRVGRFGWKARQATLLAFAADAYLNEIGITNRYFPTENAPNGNQKLLAEFDHVASPQDKVDPATGKAGIDRFTDFMRLLAPPAPPRVTAEVHLGWDVFIHIGCTECHVPTLYTGTNQIEALNRKPVMLFSDLLLHDMGSLNDGIAEADALPNEMETTPLWGLRWAAPYLHDGRAPTVADAILAHDGESAASRDRFNKLPAAQQHQLVDFLNSL